MSLGSRAHLDLSNSGFRASVFPSTRPAPSLPLNNIEPKYPLLGTRRPLLEGTSKVWISVLTLNP